MRAIKFLGLPLGNAIAASFLLTSSWPALAQSEVSYPKAAATSTGNPLPTEIIVTAQKREQRLQDVGIAITALSGAQLAQRNITVSNDLVKAVPNLNVSSYTSAGTIFNIRGVSQNDYGDEQEPPVAVYADDTYASSFTLSSFPVFDISRVEVLRGPQGTLFGRNATGGAIQFISNLPTQEAQGYLKAVAGSYGSLLLEGASSTPLTSTLGLRVSGERSTGGNYMKAIEPGIPDVGGLHNFALRGILQWKPSPTISARLTLRYLDADHERQAALYSHEVSCPNAQLQGEFLTPDATCSFYNLGTEKPGSLFTGYRNDSINPIRGGDPWKTAYTHPSYVNRKTFSSTLRVEAHLGAVDLTSITDYQHATKFYIEDTDGTPDAGADFYAGSRLNQITQEVRLSGGAERNHWIVGAFGMAIDGHYTGAFNLPYLDFFPTTNFSQKTRSFAFFAQDEFALTSRVKLIGGLRYWHDNRVGYYHATEATSGLDITFAKSGLEYILDGVPQVLNSAILTARPQDADRNFSGLMARAEVDYKPTKGVLIYASYNRGSKSGGFTFPTATPAPGSVEAFFNALTYKPETLDDYEGGVKLTLGRSTTLNVAAFHYNYRNYQAFAQEGIFQTVLNLNARVTGLEYELVTSPARGLTLSANGSLLWTKVFDVPLPDGVSFANHPLPQTPRWSGSALARYEFGLAGGKAALQADTQFKGSQCFNVLCAPTDRWHPYALVDAQVGYSIGRYEFSVFVNNVLNRKELAYSIDNSLTDGFVDAIWQKPRMFGFSAKVSFGG